jgi:uncharacterized protein
MTRYYFPPPNPTARSPHSSNAVEYTTILESKYPRIMENIVVLWGFQEMNEFFRKLILDDRGDRQGFPPEAWDELNTLSTLHLILVPDNKPF